MRKHFTILFSLLLLVGLVVEGQDSLVIQGEKYKVDTLVHEHDIGLGAKQTKYNLPDFPLVVSVLKVDLSNPYVEVMSVLSNDSLRGLERPSQMAARKSNQDRQVFGGTNADFFITSGDDKGMPVNGQILDGQLGKVPVSNRPVLAFDNEKQPFTEYVSYSGSVSFNSEEHTLHGVNNSREADQLILYNSYFGNSTRTNQYGTEVVVSPETDEWGVNSPVSCTVEEVRSGVGNAELSQGEAVLSGHGTSADFLNTFQAGDPIEVEVNIDISGDTSIKPDFKEMVGGDRIILDDGNVVDNDWPQQHPRTGAGYSADKSKMILTVVDGRTEESAGVSTKQLADIMKLSGAAWAINLDGGGSSAMVVRDQISNNPSDGYERSVANGLFFASTAPASEAVSFRLNADRIKVPFGSKEEISASTFDEYDDVVDYLDASGVEYHVEGGIGDIDADGMFHASGTPGNGLIIGSWEGLSDTVHVEVEPAEDLVLSAKDLTIDHLNEYSFDVYAQGVDGVYYPIDNELVNFESLDTSIGEISQNGVFNGKSDGEVVVRGSVENTELSDECLISVEIGRGHRLMDDFSEPSSWTVSDYYLDEVDIYRDVYSTTGEEMLRVDFSMTYTGRTASIILSKNMDVYGMPDSLLLKAVGTGKANSFLLSIDHNQGNCRVPSFSNDALSDFMAAIDKENIAQKDYPLSFESLRLNIEKDESYVQGETYEGTFFLKSLEAVYPEEGVPNFTGRRPSLDEHLVLFPNPASDFLNLKSNKNLESGVRLSLISANGSLVKSIELDALSAGSTFPVSVGDLPKGVYVVRVQDEEEEVLISEKIVIGN